MLKYHSLNFTITQSRTVRLIIDVTPCVLSKTCLKPFHLIDNLSYRVHRDTLNAIACLNEEQRLALVKDLIDTYPNGVEVAEFLFKKAGLPLPTEKAPSKLSNVIKFPTRFIKKDKTVPDNIIDTRNMSVVEVLRLGADMSPVSFHSCKTKISNINTYLYRWAKVFSKTDQHSLKDLIETTIFLCNGHSVHFNLNKGCDKKGYIHHIFNTLARIGCKAVRGSTGRSNSFISALDLPDSLRAFVEGLPKDYVEQVLSSYDNVYAYEISKTKGLQRSKNKEAVEWTKTVKAYMEATMDKVITQFNTRMSLSHTLKVAKGLLNRETVKGVCLNKKLRSSIRMQSLSGYMDNVVEVDTCGAYLNQMRMEHGMEALEDPYGFLPTDRDTAKGLCLRLICGTKRAGINYLKEQGCDPLTAENLVNTFYSFYIPDKRCYDRYNHLQQIVMIEMYKLATKYKMAFIANADGILVAKSDALIAKVLYQQAWLNVTGKHMPVKIKCQDSETQRKAA